MHNFAKGTELKAFFSTFYTCLCQWNILTLLLDIDTSTKFLSLIYS